MRTKELNLKALANKRVFFIPALHNKKNNYMATWQRNEQECEGTYFFNGEFYITRGVQDALSPQEITAIYQDVQQYVKEHNGADYLFVFTDEQERKLFFIDQLNTEMIASGQFAKEYNYCTLLFAEEY